MELLIEVSTSRGDRAAVRVELDATTQLAEVAAALAAEFNVPPTTGIRLDRTGASLPPNLTVADVGLVHGDRLVLGTPSGPPPTAASPRGDYELIVTGGPDAGGRFPLTAGQGYQVGRTTGIVIHDPRLSRAHFHIGVGSKQVVITDLGSANGTFIDGQALTESTDLRPGQVIEAGASLFSVVRAAPASTVPKAWDQGRTPYSRPPRVTRPLQPTTVHIPAPPLPPGKRKLPLTASLIPLVMGGVMALIAGPLMLLMALLSPVMMLITAWEDAKSGRRSFRKRSQAWDEEFKRIEAEARETHATMLRERRAAGPDQAELAARVVDGSPRLWERRFTDADFLTLRVGTTDLPSALRLDLPERNVPPSDESPTTPQEKGAQALVDELRLDHDVPADVGVPAIGALGITGDAPRARSLLRWLVMQAAILHSPRDLGIVGLLPSNDAHRDWDWLRWLPHTETLLQGVPGARSVATEPDDVRLLAQAVEDLIVTRRLRAERGTRQEAPLPWLLVVIPGETVLPAPQLSRLIADGAPLGVSFLIARERADQVPGECRAIVAVGTATEDATVTLTASGDVVEGIVLDGMGEGLVRQLATGLAPLYDATSAGATGEVPRAVLLLDVLGMPEPTAQQIRQRWQAHAGTGELSAPIGVGSAGVVHVDLRRDGPHGLTAGTTGSGKSETLLGYLGALAATYPASTLTFVLVDYKGGAAFADCVALPHTVGFFTDLDPHLAQRALVSLNAELRRREHVLSQYGCKDLIDLERRNPEAAPANLFLVFDEFAFLKKEVPEFVAGVIDIAQRGRSLGVHLMLATQRPAGVIDDNIRANTNLRIALRMADPAESNDVLDRDDAAQIPKGLPGRAFVRVGHSEVTLVQSSYASARTHPGGSAKQPTKVSPFRVASGLIRTAKRRSTDSGTDQLPTDLQRLVAAIRQAHDAEGIPDQPHPWLDPMPELIDLAGLAGDPPEGASDLAHPVGMIDLPAAQTQETCWYDPARAGSMLVYGTSGTGKTQLLRTVAASLADRLGPADVSIYGLDFAGRGLAPLTALPQVGGIVTADDAARVDGLLDMLSSIVASRTELLGRAHAASLSEYRAAGGRLPWVVVLMDGYGAFRQAYLNIDRGEQLERFDHLVSQGRAVGVLFVISADRRNAVPSALSSSVSTRLVMRLADADEYASLGLPSELAKTTLAPGRGFLDGEEVQVAVLGDDATGAGQAAALAALGARIAERFPGQHAMPVQLLPDTFHRAQLPEQASSLSQVWLGLSGDSFAPVAVDLADNPLLMVLGSSRSGLSTCLATLSSGAFRASPGLEAYLLAPRRSPLLEMPGWRETARGVEACEELVRRLEVRARQKQDSPDGPWLIVLDDGDELAESLVSSTLETLIRRARDVDLMVLAAVTTHTAQRAFGGWVTALRKVRHGMLLDPQVEVDGDLFGIRLPRKSSRRYPPGRGYYVGRGPVEYVQVAAE